MAVVEREEGRERLVHSECLETSSSSEFTVRLNMVVERFARLLEQHVPNAFALERLYVTKNQKTAMRVAEVRGALIQHASRAGVPVFEYTPSEVKAAATGFGKADKEAVARMLNVLLKIEKDIEHDDEYDAIAIGVTHLARHNSAAGR